MRQSPDLLKIAGHPVVLYFIGFLLLTPVLSVNAAQVDYFLKIPDIDGESTDEGHKDWINLLSVSSSITRPMTSAATFGGFVVEKSIDKATPKLMEACATGQAIPSAQMEFIRVDESRMRYYEIKMENVYVTSFTTGANSEGNIPEEKIILDAARITWTYTEYDISDRPKGDIGLYWDFVKNEGGILRETFRVNATRDPDSDDLSLSWEATPGKVFSVFAGDNLNGPFSVIQTVLVDDDRNGNVLLPVELGNRFFYVEEAMPPQ